MSACVACLSSFCLTSDNAVSLLPLMCCHCRCCCNSTFLTYIMRQYFNECCLRLAPIDIINNRLGIEGLDSQILCSRITRLLAWKEKDLVTGTINIEKSCACASFFPLSCTLYIPYCIAWSLHCIKNCISSVIEIVTESDSYIYYMVYHIMAERSNHSRKVIIIELTLFYNVAYAI